jgi:hypothetical protein
MSKDWRVVVFCIAIVVVAVWILWWESAGYPLDGAICVDEAINDNCPRYNVILYTFWRVADFVSHWAALIAAVSAAIIAVFAVRLWRSTENLSNVAHDVLKLAERRAKKELRPYLAVEPLGITEYIGQNCLVGHFAIRNFGKLPAHNVSVYSTIALDADGGKKDFSIGTPRISPTVLQPGAKMEFGSYEGYPIPADQLDSNEPLKLKGYLYVWGEVLYTDEFNTVGWVTFCHRYPGDMFGMAESNNADDSRAHFRCIDRKFAQYHEEAGNDAG